VKQLTKEEMLQRLESDKNLINIIHRRDYSHHSNGGEHNGRNGKFTPDEREAIVSLASKIGTKEAADLVGCHRQSIGDFSRGITSHRTDVNFPSTHQNQEIVENNQDKISVRAIEKVLHSIDLIDDVKLKACNAVELATVASRLANIGIRKGIESGRIQVNIYTPSVRSERDFEFVTVRANEE